MSQHKMPPHKKPFLSEGIYSLLIVLILLFTMVASSRIFTTKPPEGTALQWAQYPVSVSSIGNHKSTQEPANGRANKMVTNEVMPLNALSSPVVGVGRPAQELNAIHPANE